MKTLKNFLVAFPRVTRDFIVGYLQALKAIWTPEYLYWNFQQSYFEGDDKQLMKQKRNEYIKKSSNLIKEMKEELIKNNKE
jgi:hypothetical protein